MTNRAAEMIVRSYIQRLPAPETKIRQSTFEQCSLERWAAKEILRQLNTHPDIPPAYVIEEFTNKMEQYSVQNPHTSYVFSVAYDVGVDILDCLCHSHRF